MSVKYHENDLKNQAWVDQKKMPNIKTLLWSGCQGNIGLQSMTKSGPDLFLWKVHDHGLNCSSSHMLSSEVSVSLLNRAHRSSPYPGLGAIYVISVVSPDTFIARLNYYSVRGQCVDSHSFCSSYFQNLVIPTTLIRSNICGGFFAHSLVCT